MKRKLSAVINVGLAILLATLSLFTLVGCKNIGKYQIVNTDYYKSRVSEFAEENKTLPPEGVDCVFIGDSWTDGYRYLGEDSNTDGFYNDHYAGINVLNRGIGGDNSYGLLQRLDVSVYQAKPKVVVMLIGVNNMYSCDEDIERIITEIKKNLPNTKIVMQSTYTVVAEDFLRGAKKERLLEMCAYFYKLCLKYNLTYVDVYSHLLDENGDPVMEYHVSDKLHMSKLGYEVITAQLRPVILKLLGREE